MKTFITYWLYPILLFGSIITFLLCLHFNWDLVFTFAILGGARFTALILVEFIFPYKEKWKMTMKSFIRDLKWIAIVAPLFGGIKFLMQLWAIDAATNNSGFLSDYSILTGLIGSLLTYEFFQYWFHRISHEGKSKFNKWLWKIHIAHHLPKEVYLLMHVVGHPINAIMVIFIVQGSLLLVGAKPESIFMFNVIMGLQGLVSHFNVEIKAGWLNYVFIGTELHRFHHSADMNEAKNYGATISLWDIVFGTFYYKPDKTPQHLGIANENQYPESNELWKVLKLPFTKTN